MRRLYKMRKPVVAIIGRPNVGKSKFINKFVNKNKAKVGNTPGFTRGKQWIKINDKIELLDTPGVLWPKFEDEKVALKSAVSDGLQRILSEYLKYYLDVDIFDNDISL